MNTRPPIDVLVVIPSLLILLQVSSCMGSEPEANSTRYELHEHLFDKYNKHVRPSHTRNLPIEIRMGFVLQSVQHLYEREQRLVTANQVMMLWHDRLLEWDPEDYGNITELTVEQQNVWIPDVNVGNSMVKLEQMGYDRAPVRITSNGWVIWSISTIFETSCGVDITYFPFDVQACTIIIEALASDRETLLLVPIYGKVNESIDTLTYMPSSKWKLVDTWAEFVHSYGLTVSARFHLSLKRRPVAVILNIMVPLFFLALTAALVFGLPIDSGERLGMAITVILAYAVYLTILSDKLPESSVKVAALSITILILILLCTLIVLATVAITSMFNMEGNVGRKMDKALRLLRRIQTRLIPKAKDKVRRVKSNGKKKDDENQALELEENSKLNGSDSKDEPRDQDAKMTSRLTYTEGALILDTLLYWFFKVATAVAILGLIIFLATAPSQPTMDTAFHNPFEKLNKQ